MLEAPKKKNSVLNLMLLNWLFAIETIAFSLFPFLCSVFIEIILVYTPSYHSADQLNQFECEYIFVSFRFLFFWLWLIFGGITDKFNLEISTHFDRKKKKKNQKIERLLHFACRYGKKYLFIYRKEKYLHTFASNPIHIHNNIYNRKAWVE